MTANHPVYIHQLIVSVAGTSLFKGLSLSVAAGEKVTLTGASGSGKTTLLRCLMGFVQPEGGEIRINDVALDAQTVWRLRASMAYVAQEPDFGDGVVADALAQPFAYRLNRHLAFDRTLALDLLDRLLLPTTILDKRFRDVSGGEKQRIALVAALLLKRDILLLDEAASALDGEAKRAMRALLCAADGLTVLSVSHDTRDFALSGPICAMQALSREEQHP